MLQEASGTLNECWDYDVPIDRLSRTQTTIEVLSFERERVGEPEIAEPNRYS